MISNYIVLLQNCDRAIFVMFPNISLKYFGRKHCTPCKFHWSEQWILIGWPIFFNVFGIAIPLFGILVSAISLIRYVTKIRMRVGRGQTSGQRKNLRNTIVLSLFYLSCVTPLSSIQCLRRVINFSKSCHLLRDVLFAGISIIYYS
ncbi:hypothetical protein GJ496_010688 [Pomphorhynchus laevis]|nr:hypothetical protein GJ496_010688 [Pomphorhynchus laevis]